jgi:hypothetical protein
LALLIQFGKKNDQEVEMDAKEIPITFVAFYGIIEPSVVNNIRYLTPSYTHHDQKELLQLAFDSAKKFHPNCQCIVLTDKNSQIPENPLYKIYRYDVDLKSIMLAAMITRAKYLKHDADPHHHVIFMDTDILVQDHLNHIFEQNFDVGLTYRDLKDFPINGGIYFIHQKGIEKGAQFFFRVLAKMYKHCTPELMLWWGDQIALRKFIGKDKLFTFPKEILTIEGIRFYFLYDKVYNFSTLRDVPMKEYYPQAKILHFKGKRKVYMKLYWEKYLNPKSS